jgi:tetratricopeptide (TPR) repeat protein
MLHVVCSLASPAAGLASRPRPRDTRKIAPRKPASSRSWRSITRASPDETPPPGGGGGSSAQDAIAARLAKAKEYQAKAQEASKNMGKKAELQDALREAQERLEEAKKTPPPPPNQKQQVKVKIVTRDNTYNPFGDDERIVGYEEGQTVYTPDTGGWGGDDEFAPSEEQKNMLTSGRRRERGLGVDNEAGVGSLEEQGQQLSNDVIGQVVTRETNEKNTNADGTKKAYQPKVSTWGVFERPDNISKEFGGGRKIGLGGEEESPEQIAERRARVQAKLGKWRQEQGMDVDEGTKSRWYVALKGAKVSLSQGKFEEGIEALEDIVLVEKINPRSELGGELTFTYGMLLDNAQRRDEALDMYKRCIGNQYGRISKQADQLIWGMTTAAKKMKADQFDYDGIKDKYDPFLIALTKEKQWKQIEVSEEEEEELNKMTTGSIALVAAVPIAALLLIAMH